jgi:hypothetical protein
MYSERSANFCSGLRAGMAKAGIVEGWRHVCRRRGCTEKLVAPDAAVRRCPAHQAKLWPKPIVRRIRWHDLRHTTATLLLQAGVSIATVQKLMRHSDSRLTTEVYGHFAPDFLQGELSKLRLHAPEPTEALPVAVVAVGGAPEGHGEKSPSAKAKDPSDYMWLGTDSNRLPADYETAALTS